MKIVYYSHYFTPEIGAPSARIHDLALQWLRTGHDVQVVTCFPNHPIGRLYSGYQSSSYLHENVDGIKVHRHWTYVTPNKAFVKRAIGHLSFWPAATLISGRRVDRPDVVIGTSPTFFAAMAAAAFARRWKLPFIMEVRDLWPAIFVELGVLRNRQLISWLERLEMRLYRQATKIVTVTEAFKRRLIERCVPEQKICTVTNGADVTFWDAREASPQIRQRYQLEDRFIVLYIGAHGISHGLDHVIDSALLLKDLPAIHFLFVGEGAVKQDLIQKARQLALSNITFLDSVGKTEVRDFYAAADVCLVPLRAIPLFQSFIPSKIFEMLAMARPIVGSLRGEAADILRRSGAALIVEPEDSRAMAEALVNLYQQAGKTRREMGESGRQFVKTYYSRQALAAKYLDVMTAAVAEYQRS